MALPFPPSWLRELQSQGESLCPQETKARIWSRIQQELNLPSQEDDTLSPEEEPLQWTEADSGPKDKDGSA